MEQHEQKIYILLLLKLDVMWQLDIDRPGWSTAESKNVTLTEAS